jgi:hypothetical protein
MNEDLDSRFTRYINPDFPLGPADAGLIRDNEVAAQLFDPHNQSFNLLLQKKNLSVLIGRRGSGKTALLNSYLYRPFLIESYPRDRPSMKSQLTESNFVVRILSSKIFEEMHSRVQGPGGLLRPIEGLIDDWEELIIDYALSHILFAFSDQYSESLRAVEQYLNSPDIEKKAEAQRLVWGDSFLDKLRSTLRNKGSDVDKHAPRRHDALEAAISFLSTRKTKLVILFDSLDEYEIGDERVDRIVGALVRFVAQFNALERAQIKLALPAEIFPEVQRASVNPLKDFYTFDRLRWSSLELAAITAHRYRVFLRLFDPQMYQKVSSLDLSSRHGISQFWNHFFTERILNSYGQVENTMTYILRHTFLLPRQVFAIIHSVIVGSQAKTGGYRILLSECVANSVVNLSPIIAEEILQGFKHVYPWASELCRAVFGGFPSTFSYDDLENQWRRVGRRMMASRNAYFELVHFCEMALRIGIMGAIEQETERYLGTTFAHDMLMPFAVGGKNRLAMHPAFARYFSCAPSPLKKSVLLLGAEIGG